MPRPVVPMRAAPAPGLAGGVEIAVQGQHEAGGVGQDEDVRIDGQALGADTLDLVEEGPGVDDDAVADHRQLALGDAGREQGEAVLGIADDDGVAGVVAALEAHDHVGAIGQPSR